MTDKREFERVQLAREKARAAFLKNELMKIATTPGYATAVVATVEGDWMGWAEDLLARADAAGSLASRIEGVDLGRPFDQAVMDEARALRDAGMSLDEVAREMDSRGLRAPKANG